ncbi:MAG TPA: tetratricopeptide repeat protein [Pirellulales bacterium]|jgi:tetratricopeptide (TPR) repeat protein|nr:tetratricopeptide repeat protein [Pirellulales bacterium]
MARIILAFSFLVWMGLFVFLLAVHFYRIRKDNRRYQQAEPVPAEGGSDEEDVYEIDDAAELAGWLVHAKKLDGLLVRGDTDERALADENIVRGLASLRRMELEESETMLRQALFIRERIHGPDDVHTAAALIALGRCRRTQGAFAESQSLLRRGLEIQSNHLGEDDLALADGLLQSAWTEFQLANYRDAEGLAKRSLDLYERHGELSDARIASVSSCLGSVYLARGAFSQVEDEFRRACQMVNAGHPFDFARGLWHEANLATARGRFAEAIDKAQAARALIDHNTAPDDHLRLPRSPGWPSSTRSKGGLPTRKLPSFLPSESARSDLVQNTSTSLGG